MSKLKRKKSPLPNLIIRNPFDNFAEVPERMVWTASALKLFRNCKRKFFWKYILRIVPKYRDHALMIGSAFHQCIAEWYRSKRSDILKIAAREAIDMEREAVKNQSYFNQEDFDKLTGQIASFHGMMGGYAECYGSDRKKWTIKRSHIEVQYVVDMGDFDFSGQIDLIATQKQKHFIVEHKTATKIGQSYLDRLPLDTQCRAYIFGALKGLDIKVSSVLYDVVRKTNLRRKSNESQKEYTTRIQNDYAARPEFYFFREPLLFSKHDIAALEHEIRQTHREFITIVKDRNPLDPRSWPINDSTCDDYFRLCPYHTLCTKGLDQGTGHMYEQREAMHMELEGAEA